MNWSKALKTLRVTGILGVGLLLAASSLYFSAIAPMLIELEKRQLEEQQLDARLRDRESAPHPKDSESTSVLAKEVPATETALPLTAISEAPALFDQLYALGEQRKLLLERATYSLVKQTKPSVTQYQITLPFKCSYPELRIFLRDALALAPVSSLDSISLQRARASDPVPDVSVTLSYYFATE